MADSSLVAVVSDITRKLIDGDWADFETDTGQTYYIVGHDAWMYELGAKCGRELPTSKRKRWRPSPLGEHTVRSGVAAANPAEEYLARARRRLEEFGIPSKQIETLISGKLSSLDDWELGEIAGEKWDAFRRLLEAMVLVRTARGDRLPDSEERESILRDRERIYLLELARIYGKVVDRSSRLEALSFSDRQLEEASRCYLYGFWRATVTLSATALDSALAKRVDPDNLREFEAKVRAQRDGGYFRALVRTATEAKLLGERTRVGEEPAYADAANFVFDRRNQVVHKGAVPDADLAERVLDASRRVIEHLVEGDSR